MVKSRKTEIKDVMLRLEDQLVAAHFEAKAAWEAGATKEEMKEALQDIRHAQWRWDYAAAGHGGHIHAPDVLLKVIGTGLDKSADARTKLVRVLAKHGITDPVQLPDISTAENAWKATGVDIEKNVRQKPNSSKLLFLNGIKKPVKRLTSCGEINRNFVKNDRTLRL